MREPPRIREEHLRTCVQDQYDLDPVTLAFLPLGKDYNAGVYRVMSQHGTAYLLKVKVGPLYEPSCLVPHYLQAQGITSVVAPVPTKRHALWTQLGDWTVIVYPWISGDSSLTGMTHVQWKEVGTIFQRIHQVRLQPEGFSSLRKETFDPSAYARWVRTFETQYLQQCLGGSGASGALCASWVAHQSTIHTGVTFLEKLAAVLKERPFPSVICHADLHPANLLRDPTGHVFVIDWDEVMLAPKERDFIFVRAPHAEAFWAGYGQRGVDGRLLAYYLWERVVQDVIYYAHNVCFRDDWAEETRAEVAQMFHAYVAEGGHNIAAAYAAAAHLASDLTVHTRDIP
jgi:spectinomycin phosphotransferase